MFFEQLDKQIEANSIIGEPKCKVVKCRMKKT